MRIDVPGRGRADIHGVAVVGPVWTDPDMYREACAYLQATADAAAGDAVAIEFDGIVFQPLRWRGRTNAAMLRQMVRDLADEFPDGRPRFDGVCVLDGWTADGAAALAVDVARACDAAVMGLDEWTRALAPADGGKRKGGE